MLDVSLLRLLITPRASAVGLTGRMILVVYPQILAIKRIPPPLSNTSCGCAFVKVVGAAKIKILSDERVKRRSPNVL